MKTVIRPETEMKDSGIEWVENIPKNWRLRKINSLFETIGSGTTPNSNIEEYYQGMVNWLQSGDINGTIVKSTKKHISNEIISSTSALTVYKAPFIVIAMYGASIGNISMVDIDACTNQACCALVKPIKDIDMQYAFWGLMAAKEELVLSSRGGGQPNISQNIIKQLRVPVPYLQEQQAIADYLDETCSKIDEIIAEAKASIDEYKELKQSVIFEAVTKGLDKNVEMKDSGYDFIGSIPKHWNITKLKRICSKISDGSHFSPETMNNGFPYVTASDVHGIGIDYGNCKKISKDNYDKLVKSGCRPSYMDVLIVKDGATTGRVGLKNDDKDCVLLSSVAMLTPKTSVDSYYLMWLLSSEVLQFQIKKSMAGSAMPRITLTKLNDFIVIDCPFEEQTKIVNCINEVIPIYDSLIAEKESLINDLEAYKKSLIYEVVTGKRKVV